MKNFKHILIAVMAAVILSACSPAEGNFTGSEYMPDMAHSVAYEANVFNYYFYNTWDSASTIKLKELSTPRKPVEGTVPRGYAGVSYADASARSDVMANLQGTNALNAVVTPINGSAPFYYGNTEEERQRAIDEIIDNPFPITADGLARGKALYDVFCGICHGEKGDGLGYLASDDNPNKAYAAAPAVLISDDFIASSNGRFYHSIFYGRNLMGAYADKLSYEERWQVIHHIRSLQAKEKKLAYDENANTLNSTFGTPVGQLPPMAENDRGAAPAQEAEAAHEEGHEEGGHDSGEHDSGHR